LSWLTFLAATAESCKAICRAVEEAGVILAIGHVMRYTPYSRKIKALLDAGAIGRLINVQHLEPIGFWHFAHSYVRGNWRNEALSSSMLLAKACHV
jgi:predicted dehydrogenase